MKNLLDYSRCDLESLMKSLGEPAFRAAQVHQWIWQKRVRDFAHMTNISKVLREKLAAIAVIDRPVVDTAAVSSDGTVKFLLRMTDGSLIETVLIPAEGRFTQCLSTQVGCVMGCTFCSTGRMGFERNLTSGEILGQVLAARDYIEENDLHPLKNLVFMGMGEPLLNLEELKKALGELPDTNGLCISPRRITVSTVGFPDQLMEMGQLGLALPAISLHAPTQELRARIMPKAARVHLDDLMDTLRRYPLKPRERITFEYLLLKGVNDTPAHARQLVKLTGQMRCKINLIAYNASAPDSGSDASPYETPDPETVLAFEKILWDKGMTATIRRSMGADIKAACGQLKADKVRQGA